MAAAIAVGDKASQVRSEASSVRCSDPGSLGSPAVLPSPGELHLELPLVVLNLDLDLEVDLVGDVDLELEVAALVRHVVVAGEGGGQRPQARGGLLASNRLLPGDLEQVHSGLLCRRLFA